MFKEPSHYFFNISFDWSDVYNILEVTEEDRIKFEISDEFRFDSPNGHSNVVGINESMAMFEYYVMPGVLKNAGFKADSTIYDCQYKRFFSTINLVYRNVLTTAGDEDKRITCSFQRFASKDKSIFSVIYSESILDQKFFSIVFPSEYLNRQNAGKEWGKLDEVRTFKYFDIHGQESNVEEVESPKSLLLNILLQSEHDASSGPGFHRKIIDAL